MFIHKPFIGFLFLLSLISCRKKDNPPYLDVSPKTAELVIEENKNFVLDIVGKSQSSYPLVRLSIQTIDSYGIKAVSYDTAFSSENINTSINYKSPSVSEITTYTIKIALYDGNGLQTLGAIRLKVTPTNNKLREFSGVEMYSKLSNRKNGFNFNDALAYFSSIDPQKCDIRDDSAIDSVRSYALSKKWVSEVGLQFVKFNDFDYANASPESVKSSYAAGLKSFFVSNITPGDIILTRVNSSHPDSGYVAIKIVYVIDAIDTTSANGDKYIFNYKK